MLIDVILLHLASALSDAKEAVSIVPEYAILKTAFDEKRFFGGVVDYLVTKLPSTYTRETAVLFSECSVLLFISGQILTHPIQTLGRPDIKQIGTSNIFEAKNFVEMHQYSSQVVLAAAAMCRQTKHVFVLALTTLSYSFFSVCYSFLSPAENAREVQLPTVERGCFSPIASLRSVAPTPSLRQLSSARTLRVSH